MAESTKPTSPSDPLTLKDAVRSARIEAAERTGVVVDMRDADVARLELLNEALDPVFKDVPEGIDLFDRGISRGDTPRLWLDVVAHVAMGRDKRMYRFVQDTRYGRTVIAESYEIPPIVAAVTRYIARRLVERERALAEGPGETSTSSATTIKRRRRWGTLRAFLLGLIVGIAALFVLALINTH
ncbi:MAG: hypothetical protein JO205_13755 [Pseudolabrys sp.]|nr:hypothetical protein [Pseudolabrys sp.]MBV9262425.1 hypothetical protein [Pseudolabrys sp.]